MKKSDVILLLEEIQDEIINGTRPEHNLLRSRIEIAFDKRIERLSSQKTSSGNSGGKNGK